MRCLQRLLFAGRDERILEGARVCHRHGRALQALAKIYDAVHWPDRADSYRFAAAVQFARRRAHLAELRAHYPKRIHHAR